MAKFRAIALIIIGVVFCYTVLAVFVSPPNDRAYGNTIYPGLVYGDGIYTKVRSGEGG